MRREIGLLLFVWSLSACQKESEPQGPGDVLLEFIQTMSRVHGDPSWGEKAAQFLWVPARENLAERARRASALSGRLVTQGEMIAPSWFSLYLNPEQVETRVDGKWAEVTLIARDGSRVKSRLVEEEGEWRVALELPPLSPIRHRSETFDER